MGDDFLVQKLPSCLFMCLTIIMFCAGFTLFFPLCFPFKLWWFLCYGLFSTVAFYAYFTALLRLALSFIFPWYFPEKSGTFCLFSSHFNGFILFNLFCWNVLFSHPFISLIYSFIYSYISLFLASPFHYFCSYFSSCLAVLIYLFRIRCSLLNCANSVLFLCAV